MFSTVFVLMFHNILFLENLFSTFSFDPTQGNKENTAYNGS